MEVPKFEPLDLNKLKYETVNRLIMVGNGFDLAHGLKSSFADFIHDYIKNLLLEVEQYGEYDDLLVKVDLINLNIEPGWVVKSLNKNDPLKILDFVTKAPNGNIIWKSNLLKKLLTEVKSKNWVDIEVTYFDLLAYAVDKMLPGIVITLNKEIEFIRDKLIDYLKEEQSRVETEVNGRIYSQFIEPIRVLETLYNTIAEERMPENYYFLNFNYTEVLDKYHGYMSESKFKTDINYIHGCLNPKKSNGQNPIFGFGDELDKDYKKFEEQRDNEVFKHIKSFKYLESSNYRNLMDFINSNPFQVHVYGHSCGITDRTMLNHIFEHENCISIKVYYYRRPDGTNDYTEKNYAIARHFTNKSMFRNKVVNYDYCSPMA